MSFRAIAANPFVALFFCVAVCAPARAAGAGDEELAELKRAIKELQTENRELAKRLILLEKEKSTQTAVPRSEPRDKSDPAENLFVGPGESQERLSQRVKELEMAKAAQEQATRLIIQDSLSKVGSKINESVTFGGAIEVLAGRNSGFGSQTTNTLKLNAAEIDFDIQVNPWTLGSLVIQYQDGTDILFPTTTGFESGVERVNVDRAFVTIGDTQRFPLYARAGRMSLPFGTGTGVHRTDVLSIDSPLTIDAFETRKTAFGLGFGYPTPPLTRIPPPVFAPRVNPLVIAPAVSALAEGLGYKSPPAKPRPLTAVPYTPDAPPFYGSFYLFDSNDTAAVKRSFVRNMSGRLGYRTHGHCGKPYDQLSRTGPCPWSFATEIDYTSSIFDSKFLESNYRGFLDRFGPVHGMASNTRLTLGAASLTAEWNGATKRAVFQDDLARNISIKPSAWQVSLGYQFDWNPWMDAIGSQGTYLAIGYSESRDLAGVSQNINGVATRVGFLPKKRLTLTAGEWVLDGVKLQIEYSYIRDYAINEGGTNASGKGLFTSLTYSW